MPDKTNSLYEFDQFVDIANRNAFNGNLGVLNAFSIITILSMFDYTNKNKYDKYMSTELEKCGFTRKEIIYISEKMYRIIGLGDYIV